MRQRLTTRARMHLHTAMSKCAYTGRIVSLALGLALAAGVLSAQPAAQRVGFDELRRIDAHAVATPDAGVELRGFMLPADQEGDLVYEFLLFAAPGACSHVAPPPANQVVRVIPDKPFHADHMYQSVSVSGALLSEHNKAQLYVLDGVRVVESAFRISQADVAAIDIAPPAPGAAKSPWRKLENRKAQP